VEAWTATKQEKGEWLFEWGGGSAESFEIWLDGVLLDTVEGGEYTCTEDGYDATAPNLEIMEDLSGAEAENELYPPFAILQWREVAGADGYDVEEQVGGSWIIRRNITDADAGYYTYQTSALDDSTVVPFRVTALDVNGNGGTPVTFSIKLARNPAPPDVAISIDGSNDLLIEAA